MNFIGFTHALSPSPRPSPGTTTWRAPSCSSPTSMKSPRFRRAECDCSSRLVLAKTTVSRPSAPCLSVSVYISITRLMYLSINHSIYSFSTILYLCNILFHLVKRCSLSSSSQGRCVGESLFAVVGLLSFDFLTALYVFVAIKCTMQQKLI